MRLSKSFLIGFVYSFFVVVFVFVVVLVELPKSPNQSASPELADFFSYFFSYFFFGSSRLKSLKKLWLVKKLLKVRIFTFLRTGVYINLNFLSFFQREINFLAEFLLQSTRVWASTISNKNYSLFLSLYYWKTTPKSNASFLSLKATPIQRNPPVGFFSLTAYPLELSSVFTIASL